MWIKNCIRGGIDFSGKKQFLSKDEEARKMTIELDAIYNKPIGKKSGWGRPGATSGEIVEDLERQREELNKRKEEEESKEVVLNVVGYKCRMFIYL